MGNESAKKTKAATSVYWNYDTFDQLNGQHPWMKQVPEGHISYPVRVIKEAKVTYFNFDLAKEMGLIPKTHPHKITAELEKKIIKTFSLRIINEYDQENNIKFKPSLIKDKEFMATRYLQLQHSNKQGKTSGDGRGIWNGIFKGKGVTWDVSSRGTGVTALAPGSVDAGKPLESGNTDFGYGCGLAEIDELYSSAMMSEMFHRRGVPTERVLTILDHGENLGIGVRARQNLFRPAHLFLFLKQSNYEALQRATDYLIDRQISNKTWNFSTKSNKKYEYLLEEVCKQFAHFAAHLEREYIFAWLDWDGDNVLFDGGIIDYGSIRQFGLRHDQYRYDDVERLSTNLNEQRAKARLTIQVFAQMVDFLLKKEKKPLIDFQKHEILKKFDIEFENEILNIFLQQLGFRKGQVKELMEKNSRSVKNCYRTFYYLESKKTYKKLTKVEDGVNRPAIFNLRKLCAALPRQLLNIEGLTYQSYLDPKEMFDLMLADSAKGKDRELNNRVKGRILLFERQYMGLIKKVTGKDQLKKQLAQMSKNVSDQYGDHRVTGDGLVIVVHALLDAIKKGVPQKDIQAAMDHFIETQSPSAPQHTTPEEPNPKALKLVETFSEIVDEYKETV